MGLHIPKYRQSKQERQIRRRGPCRKSLFPFFSLLFFFTVKQLTRKTDDYVRTFNLRFLLALRPFYCGRIGFNCFVVQITCNSTLDYNTFSLSLSHPLSHPHLYLSIYIHICRSIYSYVLLKEFICKRN